MQRGKRRRGRPRKEEGTLEYKQFVRAGIVNAAYDEARQSNQKHSVAVRQVVEFVKQNYPELPISETAVRRILAEWRPRDSGTILRFERSIMTADEVAKYRSVRDQAAAFQHQNDLKVPMLPDINNNPTKTVTKFVFGFGERPNYPRFNGKITKD
jgi:hypothetical protein